MNYASAQHRNGDADGENTPPSLVPRSPDSVANYGGWRSYDVNFDFRALSTAYSDNVVVEDDLNYPLASHGGSPDVFIAENIFEYPSQPTFRIR